VTDMKIFMSIYETTAINGDKHQQMSRSLI